MSNSFLIVYGHVPSARNYTKIRSAAANRPFRPAHPAIANP